MDESDDEAVAERLRQDALDAIGHHRRRIAHLLMLDSLPSEDDYVRPPPASEAKNDDIRILRGHKLAVTALALSPDGRYIYSASKDGIVLRHEIETGKRVSCMFPQQNGSEVNQKNAGENAAYWLKPSSRRSDLHSIAALAVSSDGRYLAAGGGDKLVHIFDAGTGEHLRAFPGHKDAITALVFRAGTQQLFSGSFDRCIKIWNLDDMAYIDTLFGHQAEVLCLDALRAERVISCGADWTCRLWKIPEESQLVFRANCLTIESCAYIAGGEWVTGSNDGSVSLWSSSKKKPIWTARQAHSEEFQTDDEDNEVEENFNSHESNAIRKRKGAGSIGGDTSSWVTSVAVCSGTDIVASGSGNGIVKFWRIVDTAMNGRKSMEYIGGIAVRGFVNAMKFSRGAQALIIGVGQEPRMGRWARDKQARNGIIIVPLSFKEEEETHVSAPTSDSDE